MINPEGIRLRIHRLDRRKGTYEVPGPNYIWLLDGHCKLEFVGIQIYAAIDVYSRFILWVYCGVSARTAVSVKRQYLEVLEHGAFAPKGLRTDHGTETGLLALAHWDIAQSLNTDVEETLRFIDCYLFGSSTANQGMSPGGDS